MRRLTGRMNGERYLADRRTFTLHDLRREVPECHIDQVVDAADEIPFTDCGKARSAGFSECPHCMRGAAQPAARVLAWAHAVGGSDQGEHGVTAAGGSVGGRRWLGRLRGERYIGDRANRLVHDVDRETSSCQVDDIIAAERAVPFTRIAYAYLSGFDPCPHCLSRNN